MKNNHETSSRFVSLKKELPSHFQNPCVAHMIQEIRKQLSVCSQTPRLDAELLVCQALNQSRSRILAFPEQIFTTLEYQLLQSLIQRRIQGEPMAYILGYKDFWKLKLKVSSTVLIPRPETEHMIEWILANYPDDSKVKMVDLGVGSGAIALSLAAERPHWHIDAVDQCADALELAKENADSNQLNQVHFYLADWLNALPKQKYDFIVSNPPYIAENDAHLAELKFEPRHALVSGADGLEAIREIIAKAPNYLINSGYLILEHGYDQKEKVKALFQQRGFVDVHPHFDLAGLPRFITGRWDR